MDCYSKGDDQDSRKAEAVDSKKQPVKEDCCNNLNLKAGRFHSEPGKIFHCVCDRF